MTKVYILGVGAVGILLASRLIQKKIDTTLIHTSRDGIKVSQTNFKVTDADGKIEEFSTPTGSIDEIVDIEGILVVTAKAFGNELIAKKLKQYGAKGPIVIMQNGLGVEQAYLDEEFDHIYRCVLYVTSQVIVPMEIRYKPVNPSPIGTIKGDEKTLNFIVETLNSPEFQFNPSSEISKLAWQKAILNSVFNSICPLLNVDNGIFVRDDVVLGLAKEVINEILQVTKAIGIDLDEEEIIGQVLYISNASVGQLISTLQDINAQRPTEIESLNLAINRIALDLDPPIDIPRTRILGQLILVRSQNYLSN